MSADIYLVKRGKNTFPSKRELQIKKNIHETMSQYRECAL